LRKEVIIKKVPTRAFVFYIGSAFLLGYGLERLSEGKYFTGIILCVVAVGFFYLKKLEPKKSNELIKITDEKLWTRNRGNKPWNTIICIKFRYNERRTVYMDVYRSNEIVADEEVDLHGIDMPVWWLKRILKRYVRVENH
jgi:hypothetical protein